MTHRRYALFQLTIRALGEDLERLIKRMAAEQDISLNQAVIRLLRKGAGLPGDKPTVDRVGTSLDHLAGNWGEKEFRDFTDAIQSCEMLDESLWR